MKMGIARGHRVTAIHGPKRCQKFTVGLEFVNILIAQTFALWAQAVGQILGPQSHFENSR